MQIAHDCGVMKLSEFKVENLKFAVRPIYCKNCWEDMYPDELLLIDQLSKKTINRRVIGKDLAVEGDEVEKYGNRLTEEESQLHAVGVLKQAEVFEQQQEAFWEAYTAYGLERWDRIFRELTIKEINDALVRLKKNQFRPTENLSELRRELRKYCQSVKEKKMFWSEVNAELVNDVYAALSPKDWQVEKDIEIFGFDRISFMVLHFPLPKELELFRLKHISKVIKSPQKETKMLIDRLTQLESQHMNLLHRFQSTTRQLQEARAEKYNLEEKLHDIYVKQNDVARQNTCNYERNSDDIRKIKEYKGLIFELKMMNSQLLEQLKLTSTEEQIQESQEIDADIKEETKVDLTVLKGKTVGIIGGYRRKEEELSMEEYQVIKHSGEKLDNAFYELIKKADVIAVLTNYISHAAMWEAKEYAIEAGKHIVYVTGSNIEKIVAEIATKIKDENSNLVGR
jgi:Uncharacterized protein conserved in bacteria (DUF2325)